MILVLGDLHFGERDSSEIIMNHQHTVIQDYISYINDNDIRTVFLTGDVFDVRKSTNTKMLSFWKENFFDVMELSGVSLYIIVGNHDSYYKDTIQVNTITEHLSSYSNIYVYDKPTDITIAGVKYLMLPWICKDNEEQTELAIKNTEAKIVMAHPEFVGAKMESGVCTEGIQMSKFNKFDLVIAGHFHTKGEYGNITYVGTPYQMSWGDYGEEKGFHILDGSELIFHKTEHELFYRFTYDEEQNMDYVFDLELKDKYIKVVVENRTDFKAYDKFITELENKSPQDLKVIEPLMDLTSEDSLVQFNGELLVKDTEALIVDYITDLYPEKREKLSRLLLGLHSEARTL